MCDLELYTRDDAKEWLLKNHPDKGGNADLDTVKAVVNCYKLREYCAGDEPGVETPNDDTGVSPPNDDTSSASDRKSPSRVLNKKQRNKIYACMRQTENWSNMLPQHKLDSNKFNPAIVMAAIHNASPKLEHLFNIIKQVDENDMATHGRYFKHFIFSDVKEQGYGAKILASAFIANGYKNLIPARSVSGQKALKLTLLPTGADGKNKAFGLLSSSALFNSEFNQKFKKEILQMYNKRPDNIQGENMRFIILDSGFKEGIDLFDVKYVHIFEPSMTMADLKQTIGRATRTCGQKGLNFEPNVGWPLYVYNYYIVIPEDMKESYKVKDLNLLENPEEDEYIFRNANKLKDATMVYSEFDKTLTTLAEQLYKLAPVFSVDFELTKNIHRMDDAAYLYDAQQQQIGFTSASMTSLTGGAQTLKDIAAIKCAGKCGLRSTKDIPATVNFLVKVYKKHKHNAKNLPNKEVRKYLCNYMKSSPDYCQQVNTEWANRAAMIPDEVYKETVKRSKTKSKTQKKSSTRSASASRSRSSSRSASKSASRSRSASRSKSQKKPPYLDIKPNKDTTPYYLDIKPNKDASYMDIKPNSDASYMEIKPNSDTSYMEIGPGSSTKRSSTKRSKSTRKSTRLSKSKRKSRSTSALKIADEVMQELDLIPYVPPSDEMSYAIVEYTGKSVPAMKQKTPRPPSKKLNFTQMRDYIRTNFSQDFTWDPIVVENKCVEPGQKGGASRIMNLNPSQDFIRTFFTPASPYKGLLLWASVGTGKTCSAIATATASFEPEGYTILWVTRNTLKGDVYKNMFDDVCHIILAERMKKDGFVMPEDPAKRKRLLSKNWIEPISYKTFSNLLTPGAHNVYMDKLIERNGEADILRKTLIVIDEAHKLYGGDLKPSERPNMEIMERLLQKSYELSGKDSARLLIMTATPFTNSPMELFKLINLCKDNASEKITTDIKEFKKLYMQSDAGNILSEAGSKKLADKLSGYISYLNREQDPTQFAQPIMIEVPVIMSHIEDSDMRQEVFSVSPLNKADKLANKTMMKTQLEIIKVLKTRLKETQKRAKDDLKKSQAHCKTIKNRAEKAKCMNKAKQEIEDEVKATVDAIKAELAELTQSETTTKETGKAQRQKVKNMKDKIKELRESLLQEVMLVEKCKHLQLV